MFLRPEPELGWIPTHVQVTILQARGLRAKGKHGTSDAYTLIQVGKEKYSTSVVEKTPGSPEWKEECSFELSPGALERGENCDLQLIIMHRALIGLDQFLGQVTIPLKEVFQEGRSLRNQWYKLHSKPGKKEKERGEIQISIQFTRNNLTASMFDLSMKDKPKTPFGKLKEKMKGKKLLDKESSSAIVPSSVGRLDSDDEEEKKPKSKAAAFFKGRLRKTSLTKSNTSLGSDSTVSSTSVTVPTTAGISIVLPEATKQPATRNSSLSTEPTVVEHEASPRMTHKRAFSDEVGQIKMFPEPKAVQNLKPKGSPISKSSLCINGSHVYAEVPPPKPSPSLEMSSLASRSFQNIIKKGEEVSPAAVPEVLIKQGHVSEKPESKPIAASVSALEDDHPPKPKAEAKPVQVTSPMVFMGDTSRDKAPEIMTKVGPGNKMPTQSAEEPRPRVPSGSDGKGKVGGWFGSKDTPQKPSFPSGPIATSEAAERGSSLVEEHSPSHHYKPEDKKSTLTQKGAGSSNVFGHPNANVSPPLETVPEWEEQFDAFASSRLQKSPETKENFLYENSPPHLFEVHIPPTEQNFSPDNHLNRPPLEALEDASWSTPLEVVRENNLVFPTKFVSDFPTSKNSPVQFASRYVVNHSEELPDDLEVQIKENKNEIAFPTRLFSDNHSSNYSPVKFASSYTTDLSEQPLDGMKVPIKENNHDIAFPTRFFPDHPTSNHSPVKFASSNPPNQSTDDVVPVSTTNAFNFVKTSQKEIRVVPVSPCLIKDQNLVILDTSITKNPSPPLELMARPDVVVEEVRAAVEPRQQALIEHNFVRVGEDLSPEPINKTAGMEEGVNEFIKEQGRSQDIGSLAPSKPLRPMLSPAIEHKEPNVDNCQQTSLQDTTRKQIESPEEQEVEQNMVASKQGVSPVTCCPIIEVRSPILGSITEDSQSTTEGTLTNLRGGNNEVTKLGAVNGEHLLNVNETTVGEQFRTCPSNVSLDLSSFPENSNRLELINHSPSEPLPPLGGNKLNNEADFIFQKPVPFPKKRKSNRTEGSSAPHKSDHSDVLFWSALEEQGSSSITENRQNVDSKLGLESKIEAEHKPEGFISHLDSPSPPSNTVPNKELDSKVNLLLEESQPSVLLGQQSTWSADIVVDFKNEDFWKADANKSTQNDLNRIPSPGNPFTPTEKAPLSHMNPFVDHPRGSKSYECLLQEDLSFKDLHERAAIGDFPPAALTVPYVHGNQPLAFSTPSIAAAPNPNPSDFLSPIRFATASGVTTTTSGHTATLSYLQSPAVCGVTSPAPAVLPQETQPAENLSMPPITSPHPVKPIHAAPSEPTPDKKVQKPALSTALSSGLEKLKSVTTGQTPKKPDPERPKDVLSPDIAAKYYHLTHDELIQMLIQREAQLATKEGHVRELEDYIDKLLVRIMDQAPALLQAPLETKQ